MWMKKSIITLHMLYFAIETKLIAHIPGLMEPTTCDQNIVKILAAFKIATLKKATFTVLYHKHVLSEVRTTLDSASIIEQCAMHVIYCDTYSVVSIKQQTLFTLKVSADYLRPL